MFQTGFVGQPAQVARPMGVARIGTENEAAIGVPLHREGHEARGPENAGGLGHDRGKAADIDEDVPPR